MSALQSQTRVRNARARYRGVIIPLSLAGIAVLCFFAGGLRSPWVHLFYAPLVLAGFRSRREAMRAAALASVLYLGLFAMAGQDTVAVVADAAIQISLFFGLALLVSEMMRRQAARQADRDDEVRADRASFDIQHMINTAYDTTVTLDLVILKQRELLPAQSYAVLLAENNVLRVRATSNLPPGGEKMRLGIHEDDHGWTPGDGRPLVIADTTTTESRLSELDPSARSILAVPLHSVERLVGLLFFGCRERDAFPPDAIDRAEEFANRIVFPIQRAMLEEELRRLAFTDVQTNLFNHRHFQTLLDEEIRRAQRYGRSLALIFLDLDDFKAYNDTYGHPAGDALLSEISAVIRANLRTVDMAARYGGEEFVAILPETTSEQALVLADRLRLAVSDLEVSPTGTPRQRVTISAGVAAFPSDAKTKSDLIEAADRAAYEAKRSGKNRVQSAGA